MHRYFKRLFLFCFLLPAVASAAADLDALRALITSGRYEQVLQAAEAEMKTGSRDTALRFYYAYAAAQLGQTDKAIEEFRRLANELPKAPEPRNNLAVLHAQQGKFDEARRELEAALATHQSYSTAHRNLGEIYSAMAVEAYNRALARDEKRTAPAPQLSLLNSMEMPSATQIVAAPQPAAIPPAKSEPAAAAVKPAPAPAPVALKASAPATAAPKPEAAPSPAPPAPTPAAVSKAEAPPKPAPSPPPVAEKPVVERKGEPAKVIASAAPAASSAPSPAPAPETAATRAADPSPVASPATLASAAAPARTPGLEQQARAVTEAVQAWARAWAAQNPNAYLDAYAAGFQPEGGVPRTEWSKLRRERLIKPKRVEVKLVDMQVKLLDDHTAQARFLQHYSSDIMEDTVQKQLELVQEAGGWKIQREQIGQRQY